MEGFSQNLWNVSTSTFEFNSIVNVDVIAARHTRWYRLKVLRATEHFPLFSIQSLHDTTLVLQTPQSPPTEWVLQTYVDDGSPTEIFAAGSHPRVWRQIVF